MNLQTFYIRRALRLLPALAVVLLVCAPFVSIVWLIVSVGYVANWAIAFGIVQMGQLRHVWSLSVEEQFYLVWPLV